MATTTATTGGAEGWDPCFGEATDHPPGAEWWREWTTGQPPGEGRLYTAVGFAVLGIQRLQVQRREVQEQPRRR